MMGGLSYKAVYLGGHSLYPKKMKCTLLVASTGVSIPEMGLTIPYDRVKRVQAVTEKEVSALRVALLGILGVFWKLSLIHI